MGSLTYPVTRAYTTAIPFDEPNIDLGEHTVTGAITFTKVTTGAQTTFGTAVTLIADGAHIPDLSAFDGGTGAIANYDNTVGAVNQIIFYYLAGRYCVSVIPLSGVGSGGGGGDVTAPSRVSQVIEDATPARIDLTYNETLDSGSVPATGDFSVLVNTAGVSISSIAIVGAVVRITLASPVAAGDDVVLGYVPGTNKIQDPSGNDAVSFSGVSVTNNVAGAGIDADAQAYIDELIAQGVTPDGTETAGLDAFFSGLKTAGLWSKISHMGIHTWGGANPNGINAKNPGGTVLSWNGTWTYDADSSIPGSSAAAYRSGVFLSSIFTQDDAWMAHYPLTSTLVNSFEALCGGQLNDASKCTRIMHNGTSLYAEMNNPQESVLTAAAQAKLYISSRIASGSSKLWIDGTLIGTISTASTGVPGSVLATTGAAFTELGGNPYPSTRKFWFQVYGSGLFDATDAANFTALVEDLKPTLI